MKLLFDENLSERLAHRLSDLYPESSAVATLNLGGAHDLDIWEVAAAGGFVLVTRDADFHRLSVIKGTPPKVVWIRLGNCSTGEVERLLRERFDDIAEFAIDVASGFLALG